ncbi:MAG: CapA family protein [Paludibacter sp.]|nr:CapA family protein [Paludibacter sp.]
MKKNIFLFIGLWLFCSFLSGTSSEIRSDSIPEESVSLIFAGDIMGHSPQYKAAYNAENQKYDYEPCFRFIKKYVEEADFGIVNLETPVAGKPYSGYPNFSNPDALLDALKDAGYDVLLTANNHVADRGKSGLERTIRQISRRNLKFAGSYLSQEQRDTVYPVILTKDSFKIALFNYTYGTNGHTVLAPDIVNMIDTNLIKSDLKRLENKNIDFRIIYLHWGTEYQLQANEQQRQLAAWLANLGFDLVIGSHPHVVQNAEFLQIGDRVVPVIYSLGNSISNQRKENTNGGIMLQVSIGTKNHKVNEISYMPVYVYKGSLFGKFQYYLIPTVHFKKNTQQYPISAQDSLTLLRFDSLTTDRLQNLQLLQY